MDANWGELIIILKRKNLIKYLLTFLQEYANSPIVHATNKYFAEKFIECNKTGMFIGLKEIQLNVANFVRDQKIYSVDNIDRTITDDK